MKSHELVILAHNIRSAYNVGSFFRTADGVGECRVVLSGYTPRPPHKGILKTALGAELSVPWEYVARPGPWLERMRRRGYHIVGLEQTRVSQDLFTFRRRWPMVLVLGNEVRGMSVSLLGHCHDVVEIPMAGQKESLNVASAMAVAVYTLRFGRG